MRREDGEHLSSRRVQNGSLYTKEGDGGGAGFGFDRTGEGSDDDGACFGLPDRCIG